MIDPSKFDLQLLLEIQTLGRLMLVTLLFVGLALILTGAVIVRWLLWSGAPSLPPIEQASLNSGGTQRRYLAFAPDRLPPDAPLLIVLHGTGQDGNTIRRYTGGLFETLARQHSFTVVYPDGLGKQWNDCRPKAEKQSAIDDVGFLAGIVEAMRQAYGIDPRKVFLFGYSNGGQMVFRLLSERPDAFKAAAVVAANLPTPDYNTCTSEGPTPPLLLAQGMKDPITPFEGGKVTIFGLIDRGRALSAEQTAEHFARRNGLNGGQSDQLAPAISRWRWTNGVGVHVERLAFAEAGHVVPQPVFRFPRIMGPTPAFDLPAYVVAFFGLNDG